jgi:hypothetical protein
VLEIESQHWQDIHMQIRIVDKGAGKLAEALTEAPISLALKGAILGQLLNQRLLESGADGIFEAHPQAASGTDDYVVELRLGQAGEVFVTALRTFGPDVI